MPGRDDPASAASVVFSAGISRLNSGVDGRDGDTGSGRCERKGRWDRVGESVRCVFQEIQGCPKTTSCRSAVARSARNDDFRGQGRPPTCGDDGICLGRCEEPRGGHSADKGAAAGMAMAANEAIEAVAGPEADENTQI